MYEYLLYAKHEIELNMAERSTRLTPARQDVIDSARAISSSSPGSPAYEAFRAAVTVGGISTRRAEQIHEQFRDDLGFVANLIQANPNTPTDDIARDGRVLLREDEGGYSASRRQSLNSIANSPEYTRLLDSYVTVERGRRVRSRFEEDEENNDLENDSFIEEADNQIGQIRTLMQQRQDYIRMWALQPVSPDEAENRRAGRSRRRRAKGRENDPEGGSKGKKRSRKPKPYTLSAKWLRTAPRLISEEDFTCKLRF